MRRITLLTAALVGAMVAASCQHDGRTLRPARPDQTASISTTAAPTTTFPSFDTAPTLDLGDDTAGTGLTLPADAPLVVTAPWRDGAPIDARYTCDGPNVAPPLSWSAAPAGTAEIAITLTDDDAPGYVHWVIAGLGAQTIAIAEDFVPLGAVEAANGAGGLGYTGPCPPAGSTHTYRFTVHYLGQASGLDDGAPGADMSARIEELTIASTEVTGTFSRA